MSSRLYVADNTLAAASHPDSQVRPALKVDCIQYVRAIAAMLVVFYHETMYLQRMAGYSALHDFFGGRPGLYGVIAFFVLSGFLMADIAPKYSPVSFIGHRVVRIYPTYWLCVVLATFFFAWLWWVTRPNADFVPNIRTMLLAHGISRDLLRLTLAPMVFPDYPLGIEWTLLYETSFYVIVFAISATGQVRRLQYFACGWLLLIALTLWFHPANEAAYTAPTIATLPFFGINSGFIFGILGARWGLRLRARPLIAVGLALVAHMELAPSRFSMMEVAAGIAAIIIGLIGLEREGSLPRMHWLRRLGDWSYAMYLVHVPVILATFKIVRGQSPLVVTLAAAVCVLLTSAVIGQIDLAVYYRLKRALDRGPAAARLAVAFLFLGAFISAALYGLSGH